MAWCQQPSGVEEHGAVTIGVPQEPGRPACLHRCEKRSRADRTQTVQAPRSASDRGERIRDAKVVPPSEGNEVTRNGQAGIGAPDMTCEAGEPAPVGDPAEGSEKGHCMRWWPGAKSVELLLGNTSNA